MLSETRCKLCMQLDSQLQVSMCGEPCSVHLCVQSFGWSSFRVCVEAMETCIICYDNVASTDEGVRRLSCNHLFHGDCLQSWIDQNLTGVQFENLEACFKKAIACPTCSRGDATTLAGVVARALPNNAAANLAADHDVVQDLQADVKNLRAEIGNPSHDEAFDSIGDQVDWLRDEVLEMKDMGASGKELDELRNTVTLMSYVPGMPSGSGAYQAVPAGHISEDLSGLVLPAGKGGDYNMTAMQQDLHREALDPQLGVTTMIADRHNQDIKPRPDAFTVQLPVQYDNAMLTFVVSVFNEEMVSYLKSVIKRERPILPHEFALWKLPVHEGDPAEFEVMDESTLHIRKGDLFEVRNFFRQQ